MLLTFPCGNCLELSQSQVEKFKTIQLVTEDTEDDSVPITSVNFENTKELLHFEQTGDLITTDPDKIIKLALAADYYNYQDGLDYTCQEIARYLAGKPVSFIKNFLNKDDS
jgi:hypothetical protein